MKKMSIDTISSWLPYGREGHPGGEFESSGRHHGDAGGGQKGRHVAVDLLEVLGGRAGTGAGHPPRSRALLLETL